MNRKIELLIQEQIQTLFESQEAQLEIAKKTEQKL